MKRLLVWLVVTFVVAVVSIPASAQVGGLPCTPTPNGSSGGAGCTLTVHNFPMDLGPIPPGICPNLPGGELLGTVNGVFHFTVNRAGDFWVTSTLTGSAVITDGVSNLFAGHLETWFGDENNKQIGVTNAVDNITGTNLATGQSVGAHLEMHGFYNPITGQFVPSPGDHTKVTCR
jgi:hypothetical protein